MASERDTVVIYDIPSKDGKCWSHHALRILYSLHYKGIPYSIENVEYPDVNSTFDPTSLKPKDDPIEPYEIPVIKFQTPTGTTQYLMDPGEIVLALDEMKPEPPLLYRSALSVEGRQKFRPAFAPIIQLVVGEVRNVLSDRSAEFFAKKRKARWGKSIDQWIAEHPTDAGLAVAEPRMKALGDWLESTPGPFVNGEQPSYDDFTIASLIGFARAVGSTDIAERVLAMHPAIGKLYDAVKETQVGNIRCQYLF
jgi:glutathione S-transferase